MEGFDKFLRLVRIQFYSNRMKFCLSIINLFAPILVLESGHLIWYFFKSELVNNYFFFGGFFLSNLVAALIILFYFLGVYRWSFFLSATAFVSNVFYIVLPYPETSHVVCYLYGGLVTLAFVFMVSYRYSKKEEVSVFEDDVEFLSKTEKKIEQLETKINNQ